MKKSGRLMPELGDINEKTFVVKAQSAVCIFGAFSIFLSGIEYLFPKPLPFLRLGLSNIPLMLALFFDIKSFVSLVIIKVVCGAIFTGSLFSYVFIFSAAGSTASAFVMYLLYRLTDSKNKTKKICSFAGLGVLGALSSNLAQLILARYFLLGKGALYIAPAVICAGIISGLALGIFCNAFAEKSQWYKITKEKSFKEAGFSEKAVFNKKAFIYFLTGAALSVFVIIIQNIKIKCALFFLFFVLSIILRKKNNYTAIFIFIFSIVFFNVIFPHGKVLFTFGLFKLTDGALFSGLEKALTFECLIFISRMFVKKELSFKGKLGALMSGTFAVFYELNENKSLIKRGKLLESIELILVKLSSKT